MESEDTACLWAQACRPVWRGNLAVQVFVLAVVCGCDFGQKACHHLYNVADRHFANLVLRAHIIAIGPTPCWRKWAGLIRRKCLDVCQTPNLYALRGLG